MVLIRVQAIMDDSNRLDRTKENIFRSIADGFNRPKTGIETIVTVETRFGSHVFTNQVPSRVPPVIQVSLYLSIILVLMTI